jgi:endo-1,4-beta-xylanase
MKRLLLLGALLTPSLASAEALKDVFAHDFLIGAALAQDQFEGKDEKSLAIVRSQFNTISPENNMKWGRIHPQPGQYDFSHADAYVAFGEANHMVIIGHNLVWHLNTPAWVFEDEQGKPLTRDKLLERLRDHIHTVVGRYKGRIKGWDVVNEAIAMDGSMRDSPWFRIIGPDYVEKAFQFAHEADPAAELYYNDYSLEIPAKRKGALALVRRLQAAGIKVAAVGLQSHDRLDWPKIEEAEAAIRDFAALGTKIAISELDIDVLPPTARPDAELVPTDKNDDPSLDPYRNGLPDAVQQQLAKRYAELFRLYLKYPGTIERVTFWNVTDAESWLNRFPIKGRMNYPTLYDRDGKPKPAYDAVIKAKEAAK